MNVTVLRTYRAQLEQALRAELTELQRALQAALTERDRLEAAVDRDARRYVEAAQAGLSASEAAGRYALMEGLAESIGKARAAVAAAHQKWTEKMAEVLESTQERKKMESLERRQLLAGRRRAASAEQRVLDEAAGRRFAASRKERSSSG